MSEALNRSIEVHTCRQQHVVIRFILTDMPLAEPIDAKETSKLLNRLCNILERHLKLEDQVLYPELMRSHDAQMRETAIRYQHDMGGLRAAVETFCVRWSNANAIAEDPQLFLYEWSVIRDLLLQRIEAEDCDLYEHAQAHYDEAMRRATLD